MMFCLVIDLEMQKTNNLRLPCTNFKTHFSSCLTSGREFLIEKHSKVTPDHQSKFPRIHKHIRQ